MKAICRFCNFGLILASTMIIAACQLGPVILDDSDSERPMAFECLNIDPNQEQLNVAWDRYNTTSLSVFSAAARDSTIHSNPVSASLTISGHMPKDRTYCTVVPEPVSDVIGVVYSELDKLGFDFQLSNPDTGEFVTGTRDVLIGSASKSITSVRWKETYYAYVIENIESGTEIRIFRDIWISRPSDGEWSNYIQERSNGYKETAVLLRINDRLARKEFAETPPTKDDAPRARPSFSRVPFSEE